MPGITLGLLGSGQFVPAKTGADGRFRFNDVPLRRWGVMIWTESGYFSRPVSVSLGANPQATGVEIKAYKAGVISGQVKDARQRPVAGARVVLLGSPTGWERHAPGSYGSAQTNDVGEYRILGIKPGRYRLLVMQTPLKIKQKQVKDEDAAQLREPVPADIATYYPKAGLAEAASVFTVGVSQVLEGDISVVRENTVCVQSRIHDPEGNNAVPVRVWIDSERFLGTGYIAQGSISGGSGFEVCGLPRGAYRLLAALSDRSQVGRYASSRFDVTTREVRVPDMDLRPLAPVRGRLRIDTDKDKRPLPGPVQVSLESTTRTTVSLDEQRFARVIEEGPFVLPAVMPDQYWLNVRAPAGFYVKSATMAGRDVLRERLHVAGDELEVVLGQDGPTFSVQVVDADGHPIEGAAVLLGRDPMRPPFSADDLAPRLSDHNGRAVFEGIAPGDYRVVAYHDWMTDADLINPEFFLAHQSGSERVRLAPQESRPIQLKAQDASK